MNKMMMGMMTVRVMNMMPVTMTMMTMVFFCETELGGCCETNKHQASVWPGGEALPFYKTLCIFY